MARRTAKIIPMPIRQRLVCSECGAEGEGTCRCGAPYIPPGERAAEAIAANPARSNRAIAADLGVSEPTVRRARKSTASPDAVEKRTGRDGKARKMPRPKAPPPKPKKRKAADTSTGTVHQQVTRLYMELKNFSTDYCARLGQWIEAHPDLDSDSKVGLTEVLEDTAMSFQRLAQTVDDR